MKPISVLLVDDNRMFLQVALEFLATDDDINVVGTARDGREALAILNELKPQIILTDLAMPGMPGLDAIPAMRALAPETKIIALTSMSNDYFRQAALEAGADDFLDKARMSNDLLSSIKRLAQATEPIGPTQNLRELKTTPRILIMEDDVDLRRLYCKALQRAGFEIQCAATVEGARDLLNQDRFDLFLCDIQMGSERGTDLLRDYSDQLFMSGAQVVMISGKAEYRDMCEDMGVDFFLEKPVAMRTLVTLANRLTARHSLSAAQRG